MPEFSRRGAAGAAPAGTPLACRRISAHSHHRGRSPGSVCPSAPGRSACPAAPTGTAPWKDPEQGPCSTALVKHGAHQDLSSGETGAAAETGGARGEYQSSSGLVERGTGAASGDGRPIGREPPGAQGLFTAWDRPPSQSMRPVCSARDRSEPGRTVRPIHSPMDQPATKDYPSVEPPVNNPLRTKWFPVEFLPWNHAERNGPGRAGARASRQTRGRAAEESHPRHRLRRTIVLLVRCDAPRRPVRGEHIREGGQHIDHERGARTPDRPADPIIHKKKHESHGQAADIIHDRDDPPSQRRPVPGPPRGIARGGGPEPLSRPTRSSAAPRSRREEHSRTARHRAPCSRQSARRNQS